MILLKLLISQNLLPWNHGFQRCDLYAEAVSEPKDQAEASEEADPHRPAHVGSVETGQAAGAGARAAESSPSCRRREHHLLDSSVLSNKLLIFCF